MIKKELKLQEMLSKRNCRIKIITKIKNWKDYVEYLSKRNNNNKSKTKKCYKIEIVNESYSTLVCIDIIILLCCDCGDYFKPNLHKVDQDSSFLAVGLPCSWLESHS
ncbi:hypothetical protein ACTFIZ_003740 [Dictyostelium cf. discoideum]